MEEGDMQMKPTRIDTSKRFSTSTYKIPTPGLERTRPARYEPLMLRPWTIVALISSMVVFAIILEIVLAVSNNQQGFGVRKNNVFPVSASVLTSFFPILIIIPASALWKATDRAILYWQPYVMLSKGPALAEDTVLLDYLSKNGFSVAYTAFKRQHWLVQASMVAALVTNLFQPLAGSILEVKQIAFNHPITVTSIRTPGIPGDIGNLNAFDAAEGFTNTAFFQGLQPPPFVSGEWAIAQFDIPSDPGLNASVQLNTTGVQTLVNCVSPPTQTIQAVNSTSFALSAQDSDGCTASSSFNPQDAEEQYGVFAADATTCGFSASTNVTVLPVLFWFFEFQGTGQQDPVAKMVLCRPQIALFDVTATVNYNNGSLTDVQPSSNYTASTNITTFLGDGKALNGVIFEPSNSTFVAARATAIKGGVPGTIFRFASQNETQLQEYFSSDELFLNLTQQVYTEFLAVSAKLVYFVPTLEQLAAQKTSMVERLIVVSQPSHALAALLFAVSIAGAVVHFLHRRDRRHVYLTHPPGSIAASTALGYHSGFGELLLPYDNDETMEHKLRNLRFGFEQRTGAIYAEDLEERSPSEEMLMERRPPADEKLLLNPHEQIIEVPVLENPHEPTGALANPHDRAVSFAGFESGDAAQRGLISPALSSPAYEHDHLNPDKASSSHP